MFLTRLEEQENWRENRKNRDKTHPSKLACTPTHPYTHTQSLFYFLSLLESCIPLLPVQRIVCIGHIMPPPTPHPPSLWYQGAGAVVTEQAQLQAWSSISPPNSTMKAGRAGRGRMSHPLLHSPQRKNPCDSLLFVCVCVWNLKFVVLKVLTSCVQTSQSFQTAHITGKSTQKEIKA